MVMVQAEQATLAPILARVYLRGSETAETRNDAHHEPKTIDPRQVAFRSRPSSIATRPREAASRLAFQGRYARATTPFAFAACVAMASMSAGDRQSYGSRPSSFNLALTAPMLAGLAPDSMMEETKAANSGGAQP